MSDFCLDLKDRLLKKRYYLNKLIAKNKYNLVFLATDLAKHRQCAVKQVNPFCSSKLKPTIESMFRQEAEILKKLSGRHEQICQFYDYFNYADSWYLVHEWIEGITLEQWRSQRQLTESEIKEILLNLLSILECIHSLGIIHQDIKPDNIVLRLQDNLPIPIDFGVARYYQDRHPQTIVGTPGYISPEQAMGKVAYSNDLYSLGLTAIYLLTGKSPQDVDFEDYTPSSDSNLNRVIDRAIASNPTRRFTSATQMRSALQSNHKIAADNPIKFSLKAWIVCLIIGLQIISVWIGWRYSTAKNEPAIEPIDSFPEEPPISTEDPLSIAEKNQETELIDDIRAVIFDPGTAQSEITRALGEPVWRKPGFWANSMAWSYENMVLEGIDLGYIFDDRTNELRQGEIAVPPSTNLNIIRAALNAFLASPLTVELEQGLDSVYNRQKPTHNFVLGDLEGIIQRNSQDRIYIAVWSADFH
jgi:serine/threonine-protein kinase